MPSNDIGVMELAAKTVGKLALVSGTYSAQYVEFEVKRAFEWLGGDRHEGKRHAAVSFYAGFYPYIISMLCYMWGGSYSTTCAWTVTLHIFIFIVQWKLN